ncbi:hypothetical protein AWW68_03505 [Roseivirga spongicola]|uniref:Uncharacterized protein n=1 Tax=Roseivirga spongicola TaxID=333140 RepID=A0A150XGK8_9BACT|nr:hypothetical protein AWW68_03505 [Roseivirga spongicola]
MTESVALCFQTERLFLAITYQNVTARTLENSRGRSSLLIAFRDSTRDCFVAKFHFVHFAPRNDGNYKDLLTWN